MANANVPFGLRPVRSLISGPYNGAVTMYYIPSTDTSEYHLGDAVTTTAGGDVATGAAAAILYGTRAAASTTGALLGPIVGIATASGLSMGVVGGDPSNLNIVYIPATKTQGYYVYVADDPSLVFLVQTDSNGLASTAFNKNVPFYVAAVPTAPATYSASYIQGGSAATTQALPLKIVGAPSRPDNVLAGSAAYAEVFVMINQHCLGLNTVGV